MNLYLAGALFNSGERLHLLYLEKHLKTLGHSVILPQREALKFFATTNGSFDVKGIVNDCINIVSNPENLFVGCADGPDADGGTCVEYGVAIATTGQAIVYRTDFRTAVEQEVGVNAMLGAKGTFFVYKPCHFTELEQVDEYYSELALAIHLRFISTYGSV